MVEQQQIAIALGQSIETALPGLDNFDGEVGCVLGEMGPCQIHIQRIVLGVQNAEEVTGTSRGRREMAARW